MRRWQTILTAVLPLTACLAIGCLEHGQKLHYFGHAELQHYKHEATSIDYADVHEPVPDTVRGSSKPRTLGDHQKDELWNLNLIEALHTSLNNNKVIQSGTVVGIGAKTVLTNPRAAVSVLDPAIQETGVLFGGRGVEAVLAALTADGAVVRFVGGCVRDAVIGRAIAGDIDLATADPPETVIALLEAAGLRALPTGIAHGTVTAVAEGQSLEITTLRRDVETDGRHAKVAFTEDWLVDAERRDFTMNALFCDADGALYDPTGGLEDARAGRVRFIGHAGTRTPRGPLRPPRLTQRACLSPEGS